jgi:HKD family nuclease
MPGSCTIFSRVNYIKKQIMDRLIEQILLLTPEERKKLLSIISASLEKTDEGHYFIISDFSKEQIEIIKRRVNDIENEKECLIEFDDHLLAIK